MDITPVPALPNSTQPAATAALENGAIEADFDTFLSLLTAQLKNQDPLKPVDSTEFVAQLAEFSAVEQQVQSNTSLKNILETLQGGDISSLATWLGSKVSTGDTAVFSGAPITLSLTPPAGADRAVLVIRNEAGVEAARLGLDPKAHSVVWAGENDLGTPPPAGRYHFSLEAATAGKALETTTASPFIEVLEARLVNEQPQLSLSNGETVSIESVTAVRSSGT
ncbi:MAG: flagellar hook capping FlgD N-terminal domain-containing protein [Pikeienuella sp.]